MKTEKSRLPFLATDVITVLVSTAAVFFALAFGGKALESYRLQRHNAMLRAEVTALKEQQKQLEARRDYVQTPEYIEQIAREQYKWAKAGEKLVITIFRKRIAAPATPTPVARPTPAGSLASASASSHWPEWWHLLTARFD